MHSEKCMLAVMIFFSVRLELSLNVSQECGTEPLLTRLFTSASTNEAIWEMWFRRSERRQELLCLRTVLTNLWHIDWEIYSVKKKKKPWRFQWIFLGSLLCLVIGHTRGSRTMCGKHLGGKRKDCFEKKKSAWELFLFCFFLRGSSSVVSCCIFAVVCASRCVQRQAL